MSKYFYGLKKKTFDSRDEYYHFNKFFKKVEKVPDTIDLESNMPAVNDQGNLGSCTWNSTPEAMEYYVISGSLVPTPNPIPPSPSNNSCLTSFLSFLFPKKKELKDANNYTPLSRLFGYYLTRELEGTVNQDSGCELRDCMKIAQQGVCAESFWPYDISKYAVKPSQEAYNNIFWKISTYHTLSDPNNIGTNNLQNIYQALALGNPIIFGFTVYSSFESDQVATTGIMPMPQYGEEILGGHAVVCIGCEPGYLKIRNSWGTNWGLPKNPGDFLMPIQYLSHFDQDGNLSVSDLWVIQS